MLLRWHADGGEVRRGLAVGLEMMMIVLFTASLGASVGSPPGRAVYGHILANAEPFSAFWSRGPSISLSAYASFLCGG